MDNNEAFFKEIKEIGIGLCSNCYVSTWRIEELWQAAQQQSAGEIAELTEKLERKKSYALAITEAMIEKDMTINVLKADNERLREAIKELQKFDVDVVFKKICNEALAKTPVQ